MLKIGAKIPRYHPTLRFPIRNVNGRPFLLISEKVLARDMECCSLPVFTIHRLSA